MELEDFEATTLSAFEADVRAEAACLLENAHLIIGTFDTAVDVVAGAISWALEHLLEAQPSQYRSRLKRQVIKGAIEFVRSAENGELNDSARSPELSFPAVPVSDVKRTQVAEPALDVLRNLSLLPRIAFVLRHVSGYSIPEASFLLGLAPEAFIGSLRRAYVELGAGPCLEREPQLPLALTQGNWTSASLA